MVQRVISIIEKEIDMNRIIGYNIEYDLPTIEIKCPKNEIDDFMGLVPYLAEQLSFQARYSFSKDGCRIMLYNVKRKEEK